VTANEKVAALRLLVLHFVAQASNPVHEGLAVVRLHDRERRLRLPGPPQFHRFGELLQLLIREHREGRQALRLRGVVRHLLARGRKRERQRLRCRLERLEISLTPGQQVAALPRFGVFERGEDRLDLRERLHRSRQVLGGRRGLSNRVIGEDSDDDDRRHRDQKTGEGAGLQGEYRVTAGIGRGKAAARILGNGRWHDSSMNAVGDRLRFGLPQVRRV